MWPARSDCDGNGHPARCLSAWHITPQTCNKYLLHTWYSHTSVPHPATTALFHHPPCIPWQAILPMYLIPLKDSGRKRTIPHGTLSYFHPSWLEKNHRIRLVAPTTTCSLCVQNNKCLLITLMQFIIITSAWLVAFQRYTTRYIYGCQTKHG